MSDFNEFKAEISQIPLVAWIFLCILLLLQSSWLFNDARKRNAMPWLWGIWGLIQFPCPLVFYLLLVRKVWKRKKADE